MMLFIIFAIYYIVVFYAAFVSNRFVAKLVVASMSWFIPDPLPFADELIVTASTLGIIGKITK